MTDSIKKSMTIFLLIATIIWITHFWNSPDFGLYEDDYWYVGKIINLIDGGGLTGGVGNLILQTNLNFTQARPVGFSILYLFAFIGLKLGGLWLVYLLGYLIHVANAWLFYTLLKSLLNLELFAVTGVLSFALFPADTTQAFLTHIHIYPGITLLLIGFHFYLSKQRKLSYLFSLASLLCYETIFPVFLAAPLLKKKWNLKLKSELINHVLILGLIFLCTIIIRKMIGESRATDVDVMTAIQVVIRQIMLGPMISIQTIIYRPFTTLFQLNKNLFILLFLLLCFPGMIWILSRFNLKLSHHSLHPTISVKNKIFRLEMPQLLSRLFKLGMIGIIMLILAYPLTLSVSATVISGRGSRVHLAAVLGSSLLLACICSASWFIARIYNKQYLVNIGLALFFTLLICFGLTVQSDYKLSWKYQRAFWTDVIQLCPDITDGTVILVDNIKNLRSTHQIASYAAPKSLINGIYKIPNLNLYYLKENWRDNIVSNKKLWELNDLTTTAPSHTYYADRSSYYTTTRSSNIILLETKTGQLRRRTSPIVIDNQVFPLKQNLQNNLNRSKTTSLYNYFINPSQTNTIQYIR